ncbi:MAG: hypothetical protein IJU64_05410 [Bacilli bacterium]|nr:hypothetical protein [Bacilli bacterium]
MPTKPSAPTTIASPDELNRHLQRTSWSTWIILGVVMFLLVSFFVWATFAKLPASVVGTALIQNGEASLTMKEEDLVKLAVGQKVRISGQERSIISFVEGNPVISPFQLDDGKYSYSIVVKEIRPIDFLWGAGQ